jgi:TPP-dependent 2-oxoacid decarboxylase
LNNARYVTERSIHDGQYNEIQLWRSCRLPRIFGDALSLGVCTEGKLASVLKAARDNPEHFVCLEVHLPQTDYSAALVRLGTFIGGLAT